MKKTGIKALAVLLSICMFIVTLPPMVSAEEPQTISSAQLPSPTPSGVISDSETVDNGLEEEKKEPEIIGEIVENRDMFSKKFLRDDKSEVAYVSQKPIHYKVNEKWEEIDNTLEAAKNKNGEDVYKNKSNFFSVEFPKDMSTNAPIKYIKGDYELTIKFNDISESISGNVKAKEETKADISVEDNRLPKNITSGITYENVKSDTDIEYILGPNEVKENIVIKTMPQIAPEYSFTIDAQDFDVSLSEDNVISFYPKNSKDEKAVFYIPAPVMFDAGGGGEEGKGASSDIVLELKENQDKQYILTYKPSFEWLSAADCVYPVKIDPVIITSLEDTPENKNNIKDTFVSECLDTPHYQEQYMQVGYDSSHHKMRGLVRFDDLPPLDSGDVIAEAKLRLYRIPDTTTGMQINVYKNTSSYESTTVTWNSQPSIDSNIQDYQVINGSGDFFFNVSEMTRRWYEGETNNGIMLKSNNESVQDDRAFCTAHEAFYSSLWPVLIISYYNASGLESYWSYHSQDLGRAGTGYVNDFSGNLVVVRNDLGFSGNRMPVSINHVYNATDKGENIGFGYGWRTNYNQKVVEHQTDGGSYFEYIDEDGTKHYFHDPEEDGTYVDEDGMGLTLTINFLVYTITDKDNNKLVFSFGNLIYIKDNQQTQNQITISYSGSKISTVTDGAGRVYEYQYNASGEKLSAIVYKGSGSTAIRTVTYSYDGDKLVKITDQDGYYGSYSYHQSNDNTIVSAGNYNSSNYNISNIIYVYNTHSTGKASRVSGVFEYGSDLAQGGELNIDYSYNQTKFTDEDDRTETFQFNNFGNTICVQDNEGNAGMYKYYSSGAKNNKLMQSGKTVKTINNIAENSSFEISDNAWYEYSSGSTDYDTFFENNSESTPSYLGNKSLKVVKTATPYFAGIRENINLTPGNEYTLSAYVKVTDVAYVNENRGACVIVQFYNSSSQWIGTQCSDHIYSSTNPDIDKGYQRLSVTFTVPTGTAYSRIAGGIDYTTGTAYFDCFQLEEGNVANKYNLINNGNFESTMSGTVPYWGCTNFSGGDGLSTANSKFGTHSALINGNPNIGKNISQGVFVNGSEGDVYSLSAWAKANAIPGKVFQINAAIIYSSGDPYWVEVKFNQNVSDWQYVSGVISTSDNNAETNRTYTRIDIYIFYDNNANQAFFDGIQLTKDYAQSYKYDDKGNLTSTADAAKTESTFSYSNDSVSKMVNPSGTSYEYGYDVYKRVTYARSSEGLKYTFTYDEYGNPLTSEIKNDSHATSITSGEIYYIRFKHDSKYISSYGSAGGDVKQNLYADRQTPPPSPYPNQKWKAVSTEDGYFKFVAQDGTNQVMDVVQGINDDGVNICVYYDGNGINQKFKVISNSDGSYSLLTKASNDARAITMYNSSLTDGAVVEQYTYNQDNDNQKFYFEPADKADADWDNPLSGDNYYIRSAFNGMYFDVANNSMDNGGYVIHHPLHNNKNYNQRFKLTSTGDGYYKISPMHNQSMVLQMNSSGTYYITQNTDTGIDAQRFSIIDNGNGTYRIISKAYANVCIQPQDSFSAGVPLTKAVYSGNLLQQWLLEKVSDNMTSSATYTSNNNYVDVVTDSRGKTTDYNYDESKGRLNSVIDANNKATGYSYVSNSDKLSSVSKSAYTYPVGGSPTMYAVTNSYSYSNDRLSAITHNNFSYNFTYDAFGNPYQVKVGTQTLITNTYLSRNGLLNNSTYGNGDTVGYTYDNMDRVIEKKYDGDVKFRYKYDAEGNIQKTEDDVNNVDYNFYYDSINRPTKVVGSNSHTMTFSYDSKNRLDAFTNIINGTTHKTGYMYGDVAQGQTPGLIYGVKVDNAQKVSYSYDNLARLSQRSLSAVPFSTEYHYVSGTGSNSTTPLLSGVYYSGNYTGLSALNYTYDNLGNITEIKDMYGNTKAKYYYDELSQMVRENNTYLNKTIVYGYNFGGNIINKREYDYTTGALGTLRAIYTYTYGDTNWKDKVTNYALNDYVTPANNFSRAITYDSIGNPTSYNNWNYSWENGRQLSLMTQGDNYLQYSYNDAGIRTSKTVGVFAGANVITNYYLNGSNVVRETNDTDTLDYFYDEKGDLIYFKLTNSTYPSGADFYYIRNGQNDITGILDSSGYEVVTYTYDSWGKLLSTTGSLASTVGVKNPYRYRGYRYDTETGLYYLNSRYYNPELGRFINADMIVAETCTLLSANMFAYCTNNPVNKADEDGCWWKWLEDICNWAKNTFNINISEDNRVASSTYSIGPASTTTTNSVFYTETMGRGQWNKSISSPNNPSKTMIGAFGKASIINSTNKFGIGNKNIGIFKKNVIDIGSISGQAGLQYVDDVGVSIGGRVSAVSARGTYCFNILGGELEIGMDLNLLTCGAELSYGKLPQGGYGSKGGFSGGLIGYGYIIRYKPPQ